MDVLLQKSHRMSRRRAYRMMKDASRPGTPCSADENDSSGTTGTPFTAPNPTSNPADPAPSLVVSSSASLPLPNTYSNGHGNGNGNGNGFDAPSSPPHCSPKSNHAKSFHRPSYPSFGEGGVPAMLADSMSSSEATTPTYSPTSTANNVDDDDIITMDNNNNNNNNNSGKDDYCDVAPVDEKIIRGKLEELILNESQTSTIASSQQALHSRIEHSHPHLLQSSNSHDDDADEDNHFDPTSSRDENIYHSSDNINNSLHISKDNDDHHDNNDMSFGSNLPQDSFVNVSISEHSHYSQYSHSTTDSSIYHRKRETVNHENKNEHVRKKEESISPRKVKAMVSKGKGLGLSITIPTDEDFTVPNLISPSPTPTATTTATSNSYANSNSSNTPNGTPKTRKSLNFTSSKPPPMLPLTTPSSTPSTPSIPTTPIQTNEFPSDNDQTPQISIPQHLQEPSPSPQNPKQKAFQRASPTSPYSTSIASSSTAMSTSTSSKVVGERRMAKDNQSQLCNLAEQEYWKRALHSCVRAYGAKSMACAHALFHLGNAHVKTKEYDKALKVFKKLVRFLRHQYGNNSLVVARVLDKVGLTASLSTKTPQHLDWALLALSEALQVRYHHLGPHHVDVVDTLNNIAGVYLHRHEWEQARDAYVQVITVRSAIFGLNHPSVAVTAQTLGRVYSSLSDFDVALKYMELALRIYRREPMCLGDRHPLVRRVLRSIDGVQRLRSMPRVL